MTTTQQETPTGTQTALPPSDISESPGEVKPGESMTSFDEMEAIHTETDLKIKAKAVEAAAIEAEKAKLQKKEDATDGVAEELVEDGADAKEETETKQAKTDEEETVLEDKEDVKTFKFKNGEEESEINSNSLHTVKVNGEDVEVNYQELVNSYAGQEFIKKRIGELGTENKKLLDEKYNWNTEKSSFDHKIKNAISLLSTDPLAGLANFAEMSGMDGTQWVKEFNASLMAKVDELAGMTEEERLQQEQRVMSKSHEAKLKAREDALNVKEQNQVILARMRDVQEKHNIDDETFRSTFNELQEMQTKGKLQGEITPEFVADVVKYDRTQEKVNGILEVIRPSMIEDKEAVGDLVEVLINQDPDGEFGDDDIKDIILQAFPNTAAPDESLSKKVKKTSSAEKKAQKDVRQPQNEPLSFDEIY